MNPNRDLSAVLPNITLIRLPKQSPKRLLEKQRDAFAFVAIFSFLKQISNVMALKKCEYIIS